MCCETHVVSAACGPLTPAGRPSSSAASSFCFNETPGRFWKALELSAVHPIQTAASSPVPASFGPNPALPPVGCPVATATANRTGRGPAENRAMVSADVTTQAERLDSGPFVAWLYMEITHRQLVFTALLSDFLFYIILNMTKHLMTSEVLKCYTIKFRKLPLHSKTTGCVCALRHAFVSSYCPGHASCPHWWNELLRSPDWAPTWDCSEPQSGEMLGNSTPQRERRWRAEQLPGGPNRDPFECKICRGHRVSVKQDLNLTDTEQQ